MHNLDNRGSPAKTAAPVFFDPSRKRWMGFLALSLGGLIAGASVLGAVSASIVRGFEPVSVALNDPSGASTQTADALDSGASIIDPVLSVADFQFDLPLVAPEAAASLEPIIDPIVTAAIPTPDDAVQTGVAGPTVRLPAALQPEFPTVLAVDAVSASEAIATAPSTAPEPQAQRVETAALEAFAEPDASIVSEPEIAALTADSEPAAPQSETPDVQVTALPQAVETAIETASLPQTPTLVAPIPPARPSGLVAAPSLPVPTELRVLRTSPSVQVLTAGNRSIQTLSPAQNGGSSIQTLPGNPARAGAQPSAIGQTETAPSVVTMVMGALLDLVISPANAQEFDPQAAPDVYAFHVNWDAASLSSLHENILKIDTLLPDWFYLADDMGRVVFDESVQTERTLSLVASTAPDLRIVPVLLASEDGIAHPERVNAMLSNPSARMAMIDNLEREIRERGFAGVAIRFPDSGQIAPPALTLLMAELKTRFAASGLAVYAVLPMADGMAQARAIASHADAIIVESWGETRSGHLPGPLAGHDWFTEEAGRWQAAFAPEQLVFALRNIAYEWSDAPVASQLSVLSALNAARRAGAHVSLDGQALNTQFHYSDANGVFRDVWMLDAVSSFNQLGVLMDNPPRAVALDRMGTEDAAVWPLLTALGSPNPEALEVLDYRFQIARYGTGEIIRLAHEPVPGERRVTVSGDVVTAAEIAVFPRAYEIVHWGSDDTKLVALTFDDGPDPVFTPAILDILAEYEVPATFFAVGAQMLRHPGIVERIVAEGHEIGSHTYSHTNISKMSPEMLRIDLNATQRVFETITGRNLAYFRAPYAVDANPRTPSEIAPLATVGEMGYLTVNMNIDPRDWWAPDADRIAAATIRGVENGLGNIVLLHDGGGNRSETVAALPRIIAELEGQGYRFVAVSELIGLGPDDVMPPTGRPNGMLATLENFGVALLRGGEQMLITLFFLAIGLGVARSVILIVLSLLRRRHRTLPAAQRDIKVGIIVPAHNEEKVIVKTIRSLLASTYKNMEILVVDDGSTDGTFALCLKVFGNDPRVKVHTKVNGGKAEALNYGFERLKADVMVALDADTIFTPETIGWLAGHFADPRVAAVAGNAKVGNRINLLTKWQAVEYITAQNLDRRAFELLNCITVVPGAVGAWRRSAVIAAGGYNTDTLAEDADLTLRLLRAGHKVVYEERAIALTEAPESVNQLFRQRFRWMFGMLQVAFKHKDALLMRDSRSVAVVALPNILIFQILFPLVAPVADIVAILTLGDLLAKLATGSNLIGLEQTVMFLLMFCAFMLLDLAAAIIAMCHERRENWRLLFWLPFQRFYYRQLLYIVAIKAVLTAIRGTLVGWGNLARTASVKFESA